jgi:hypothetical protein
MANYFDLLNQHVGDDNNSDVDVEPISDPSSDGNDDINSDDDDDDAEVGIIENSVGEVMLPDDSISNSSDEDDRLGINSSS